MNEKNVKKDNFCCGDESKTNKDIDNCSQEEAKGSCKKESCDKRSCSKEDNSDCQKNKEEDVFQKIHQLETDKEKLEKQISELIESYNNEKLKYQADLDNFQKRIQKEKMHSLKYASVSLITELLVPLEQLEKVLEMSPKEPLLKNFLLGFKMIYQQIKDILQKEGVQEIKALGEVFDPKLHHAVEKISDKNQSNGINVAVLQKGFLYKDLVIRPVMVKINEWSDETNENK
ncbi:nucleotide exchange factor GrpE [Columbia Basin potato purple top phytoplasma]|uniref:Protein GrpE n=1 Tax=Columbia Basin potato purple top phytoplasma TaxID=307134 RepID=A0ABT5L8C0_9MOLU|nr:nucleotide exchange factor GrpE [Columbia Basin potato purple top phytoplasma]MDC9031912.1 nucleotide exchange factor GrpE [Columbia Basin potato purple top phytoplasma]